MADIEDGSFSASMSVEPRSRVCLEAQSKA